MRPGILYNSLGVEGMSPNVVHKYGLNVDGQVFIGEGKSKKTARKAVAESANRQLFNVNFIEKVETVESAAAQ